MIPFLNPDTERLQASITEIRATISDGRIGADTPYHLSARQKLSLRFQREHVILTSSGSAALFAVCRAYGITSMAVPDYGPHAIWAAPHLADVQVAPFPVAYDPYYAKPTRDVIIENAAHYARAVLAVDFLGQVGSLIEESIDEFDVPVIVDASQAIQSRSAALGVTAILSFSPHKLITCGQGGAILTSNPTVASYCREFIEGQRMPDGAAGLNLRMSGLQAAMLSRQLDQYDEIVSARVDQFEELVEAINLYAPSLEKVPPTYNVIHRSNRNEWITALTARGIDARKNWSDYGAWSWHTLAHRIKPRLGLPPSIWNEEAIFLPFGLGLSFEHRIAIAKAVNELDKELEG